MACVAAVGSPGVEPQVDDEEAGGVEDGVEGRADAAEVAGVAYEG